MQETETGKMHSLSKSISSDSPAAVEGVGLHDIPSNSNSKSIGMGDVAGSHTWSDDPSGSGSGMIRCAVHDAGTLTVADSSSASAIGTGFAVAGLVAGAGTLLSYLLSQIVNGEPLCRSSHSTYSKLPRGSSLGRYTLVFSFRPARKNVVIVDRMLQIQESLCVCVPLRTGSHARAGGF